MHCTLENQHLFFERLEFYESQRRPGREKHQEVMDNLRRLSECFRSTSVSSMGDRFWESVWFMSFEHNFACQAFLRIVMLEATPEELAEKHHSICDQLERLYALEWDLRREFISTAAKLCLGKMPRPASERMRNLSLRHPSREAELQEDKVPTLWTYQSSQNGRVLLSKAYTKPPSFKIPEELVSKILALLERRDLRNIGLCCNYFLERSIQQLCREEYVLENTAFGYARAELLETDLIRECRLRVDVCHPIEDLWCRSTQLDSSEDLASVINRFRCAPLILEQQAYYNSQIRERQQVLVRAYNSANIKEITLVCRHDAPVDVDFVKRLKEAGIDPSKSNTKVQVRYSTEVMNALSENRLPVWMGANGAHRRAIGLLQTFCDLSTFTSVKLGHVVL